MAYVFAGRYGPEQLIDTTGKPLPNTAVTVYNRGTTVKPTIYSTRTKTILANPFNTDSVGNLGFFVDPGEYDLLVGATTLQISVLPDAADVARLSDTETFTGKITAPAYDKGGAMTNALAAGFGITGDGTTDDTAAIQAMLTATSGWIHFPMTANGYRVTSTLVPSTDSMISGSGWGTFFTMDGAFTASKGLFDLTGKTRIMMRDFRIEGQKSTKAGAGGSTARGIYVSNCNHTRFTRLYINDTSHAGILWDGGTRYGVAEACHFSGGGNNTLGSYQNGISVDTNIGASSDIAIIGCTFDLISDDGVGIHNNSNTVLISGNVFDGGGIGRAIDIPGAQNVTVVGNVIKNRTGNNNIAVYDNLIYLASDVTITGNEITCGAGTQNGIYVSGTDNTHITSGVVISGNRIKGATNTGIAILLASQRVQVTGNVVTDSTSHGVYVDCGAQSASMLDIVVQDNLVRSNGGYGVWLHPSITSAKVQNNQLNTNTSGGTNAPYSQKVASLQWFGNGPQDTDNIIGGSFATGVIAVGQSATAPVIVNGSTITTAGVGVARVAPAGAVTGIILQAGTVAGQHVIVLNESAAVNTVTPAAAGTSNIANGVTDPIPGLTALAYVWDSVTALWYVV